MNVRKCSVCGVEKDLDLKHFRRSKATNGNVTLRHQCRACDVDYNRQRKKDYPDKVRLAERKRNIRKYGLTPDGFNALLEKQGNRCAICKKKFIKTATIDHDHETGVIRGLLCHNCNRGIGMFGDNLDRMDNAINYLMLPQTIRLTVVIQQLTERIEKIEKGKKE